MADELVGGLMMNYDELSVGNERFEILSRCYVDQQIGPTLSSCNRRRSSELRQSWATVVELGWNNSRTRVGVAELNAGRVAWARDAEAMSS